MRYASATGHAVCSAAPIGHTIRSRYFRIIPSARYGACWGGCNNIWIHHLRICVVAGLPCNAVYGSKPCHKGWPMAMQVMLCPAAWVCCCLACPCLFHHSPAASTMAATCLCCAKTASGRTGRMRGRPSAVLGRDREALLCIGLSDVSG